MTIKSDLSSITELSQRLEWILSNLPGPFVFSTSFGLEDQALLHAIHTHPQVRIFTLDTGRLFDETYKTYARTLEQYPVKIQCYTPDSLELGSFVEKYGPNAFYQSVELRQECCRIRKVEPLRRALSGAKTWIVGLRRSQNNHRQGLPWIEEDGIHNIQKVYPILDWEDAQLNQYIESHHIPVHPLHAKGFPSIGCAPCTRAVSPNANPRSGRWWWENNGKSECGLHLHK